MTTDVFSVHLHIILAMADFDSDDAYSLVGLPQKSKDINVTVMNGNYLLIPIPGIYILSHLTQNSVQLLF